MIKIFSEGATVLRQQLTTALAAVEDWRKLGEMAAVDDTCYRHAHVMARARQLLAQPDPSAQPESSKEDQGAL